MSTGRNYVGRGNYATPTEQTGEKATQTANSKAETSTPIHSQEFYEQWLDCAHHSTAELLAEYFDDGVNRQIKTVNHLLFHWLTTAPDLELAPGGSDHQRLFASLELIDFLSELHSKALFVEAVRADLVAAKQREVTNG